MLDEYVVYNKYKCNPIFEINELSISVHDSKNFLEFRDMLSHGLSTILPENPLPIINFQANFQVEKVIFNDPATIIFWKDGEKTVVICGPDDEYDKEKGIALCFMKKALGNKGNYYDTINGLIDPDYRKKKRKEKRERKRRRKAINDTK